jgi:hypothetical protein
MGAVRARGQRRLTTDLFVFVSIGYRPADMSVVNASGSSHNCSVMRQWRFAPAAGSVGLCLGRAIGRLIPIRADLVSGIALVIMAVVLAL